MPLLESTAADVASTVVSRYGTLYASVLCHINTPMGPQVNHIPINKNLSVEERLRLLGIMLNDKVYLDTEGDYLTVVGGETSVTSPEPKTCQHCQATLYVFGNHIQCPNEACPERLVSRIQYFVSPEGCGISELAEVPRFIWKSLVESKQITSIDDLFSPYFHLDFKTISHMDDDKVAIISQKLEYLCHMLYTYTTASTHGAFIANLLQALSIPGLTDRLIKTVVTAALSIAPSENPLIFTAGCLQQPELLLRQGAHPDDVSYLKKCITPYYQQELINLANMTLRLH